MKVHTIDDMDRLARKAIKARDDGMCRVCGAEGNQVAHVWKRRHLAVRWTPENLLWVCNRHNIDEPEFYESYIGKDIFYKLELLVMQDHSDHLTQEFLSAAAKRLKKLL